MDLFQKLEYLKADIIKMGKIAVAFSGGTDSTFLLKTAFDLLKSNVMAVIAHSCAYPEREFNEAIQFVKSSGIRYAVVFLNGPDSDEFKSNTENRCYYCKKELFSKITGIAEKHDIKIIADGTNYDDTHDFRPGMKAAKEFHIASPLLDAKLTKADIRMLSKEMGLHTWNKPSFACLATRIPYGQEITASKLKMAEKAEQFLIDIGFVQVRVRHHGDTARIEVAPEERQKFFNEDLMDTVYNKFRNLGFIYVSLDLRGYREGSMNKTMPEG